MTTNIAPVAWFPLFALACSGEPGSTSDETDAQTDADTDTDTDADTDTDTDTDTEPQLTVLASFDPNYGQLPEGVAVSGDRAYVGFAVLGEIYEVPLDGSAAPTLYAAVPPLPPDAAFLTGLTFDSAGQLYAAVASFSYDLAGGIYRAPAYGGEAVAYGTGGIVFASDGEFDADGAMYVTDSSQGSIHRIEPDGTTTLWLSDPLLVGGLDICGNEEGLFDIGANGLAVIDGALLVANTDQASIVRIPIEADRSPGTPTLFAGPDCDTLGGIDGIAYDERDSSIYAALNRQNKVVRITEGGSIETVIDDPVLDFPASVRLTEISGRYALVVTNFALTEALQGGTPSPSLIRWWLE